MRFNAIKKALPAGCHIEKRYGTQEQAIAYCKKDEFYEFGDKKNHVGRPSRVELKNRVLAGERLSSIVNSSDLSFTDLKMIEKIKSYEKFTEFQDREVIWIHGPSGSGKSRHALKIAGEDTFFKNSSKWWDGFDEEETVILDDWRPSKYWDAGRTLRILGGTPERIEYKGGSRWLKCKRIIITCCEEPHEIWKWFHSQEQIKQLM